MAEAKTCTCCGKAKPLSAYQYISSQKRYVAQCKECINKKRIARARLKGVKPKQQITDLKRGVKICSNCKQEKPLDEFYFNKATDTYNYLCKECARAKDKQARLAKGIMSASERNLKNIEKGFITCNVCKQEKPLTDYIIDKRTGNYSGICKECQQLHRQEYREKTKEHRTNYLKAYHEKNHDKRLQYAKEYRETHKEQVKASQKRAVEKNADKYKAYKARHYKENREHYRELYRQYYKEHADDLKAYQKVYQKENADKIAERARRYRETNAEYIKQHKKEYSQAHKAEINTYFYKRLQNDQLFKLKTQIRNLIGVSLRARGYGKTSNTAKILGCDYETFFKHLQDSWLLNYGQEWNGEPYHIDHIMPLATAKTEQDVIRLCHYTNLQMLKPQDNLAKKDKLNWKIPKGAKNKNHKE